MNNDNNFKKINKKISSFVKKNAKTRNVKMLKTIPLPLENK